MGLFKSLSDRMLNFIIDSAADEAGMMGKEIADLKKTYKRWKKYTGNNLADDYREFLDYYTDSAKISSDVRSVMYDLGEKLDLFKIEQIKDVPTTDAKDDTTSRPAKSNTSDVYELPVSEAHMIIDKWWHTIMNMNDLGSDYARILPTKVLNKLKEWKDATIDLIGEENFADLIQNKMGYHAEGKAGIIDFTTFFATLYDETDHEYESDAEVASRIDFWLQQASMEAMDYIPAGESMGDYVKIVGAIIDYLDIISSNQYIK